MFNIGTVYQYDTSLLYVYGVIAGDILSVVSYRQMVRWPVSGSDIITSLIFAEE